MKKIVFSVVLSISCTTLYAMKAELEQVAKKNYYQILGVPTTASQDEIRSAYKKAIIRYHPDKNPGKELWATQKVQAVNKAYQVLIDPFEKPRYDAKPEIQRFAARERAELPEKKTLKLASEKAAAEAESYREHPAAIPPKDKTPISELPEELLESILYTAIADAHSVDEVLKAIRHTASVSKSWNRILFTDRSLNLLIRLLAAKFPTLGRISEADALIMIATPQALEMLTSKLRVPYFLDDTREEIYTLLLNFKSPDSADYQFKYLDQKTKTLSQIALFKLMIKQNLIPKEMLSSEKHLGIDIISSAIYMEDPELIALLMQANAKINKHSLSAALYFDPLSASNFEEIIKKAIEQDDADTISWIKQTALSSKNGVGMKNASETLGEKAQILQDTAARLGE